MFKKLILFALLAALILPAIGQDNEQRILLSDLLKKPVSTSASSILPTYVSGRYLTNNGSVLSWGAIDLSPYVTKTGTVPLTADWNVGAFDLTAVDMTATGTVTGNNLTATPMVGNEALTNVAGWTPTTNWTYAAGTIWRHATGNATALTATGETAIAIGTKYEIVMVLTTTVAGGGLAVSLGGQSFAVVSATGAYTFNVTAISTAALAITPTSGTWVGDLTISVKILAANTGIINAEGITLNSGQLLLPNGSSGALTIAASKSPTCGIYFSPIGNAMAMVSGGATAMIFEYGSIRANADINFSYDPYIGTGGTNTLRIGVDGAAPVDHEIRGPNGTGNDKPGGALSIADGAGTGVGIGGGTKLRTSYSLPAAATAATVQTRYIRKWEVAKTWAIVDAAAAVPIITITCPAGGFVNGKVIYSLEAIDHDGAEMQCESGEVTFAALQHAAGAAYHIAAPSEVSTQSVSTGTLATSWTMTSGSNAVVLNFAADSDMDFTTAPATGHIWLRIQIILNSPQTITLN
jgi:hypothetical protein